MSGRRLYARSVRLVISSRQKVGVKGSTVPVTLVELAGGVMVDQAGQPVNGSAWGFRITWQYTKDWLWTPNNGHVTVYNLTEDTRKLLTKDQYIKAALFAGYGGQLSQVFVMDIRQANSKHEGVDWETKLEGGDGSAALAHAHANLSYGKNSKAIDIAMALVDKVGKPLTGVSLQQLQKGLAGKTVKHGKSINGNAADELRLFCKEAGLNFSIQDDQISIDKADQVDGAEIFEWGPATGLVGSPEYASPPQPGKPQLVKARGLLFPTLKVGARLKIADDTHDGEYKIRKIVHSGDTHGADFNTEAHGLPLKKAA
jgi:hypothetical protein